MYCSKCGIQIDDSARFCSSCGSRTSPSETVGHTVPKPGIPQGHERQPKNAFIAFLRTCYLSYENIYYSYNIETNKYYTLEMSVPRPYFFEGIVGTLGRYGMPVACASKDGTGRATFFELNPFLGTSEEITPFLGEEFGGGYREAEYDLSSSTVLLDGRGEKLYFSANRNKGEHKRRNDIYEADLIRGTARRVLMPQEPYNFVYIDGITPDGEVMLSFGADGYSSNHLLLNPDDGGIREDDLVLDKISSFIAERWKGVEQPPVCFHRLHRQCFSPDWKVYFWYGTIYFGGMGVIDLKSKEIFDVFPRGTFYGQTHPAVSPDGKMLLFAADMTGGSKNVTKQDPQHPEGDPHCSLFRSAPDGSGLVKLMDLPAKTLSTRYVDPDYRDTYWVDTTDTLSAIENKPEKVTPASAQTYVPRCPTCGSPNVVNMKWSPTGKQFICSDCEYRW